MGIFSDTCQALVDKTTNRALTGEALQKAKQDKDWPRCRNKVKKAARFCGKCGMAAPGGWWRCPACGKWVGNESNFCWNCKAALYPESRNDMAAGVWQRPPDLFAQRFEVGNILRLLKDGLQVQAGTAAILLDGGACKDVLNPGRHTLDSPGHKINWWGNPPPRSVVLVENGDVVLPMRMNELRSADEIPLELYAEASLHFQPKQASAFIANLFKNRERLNLREIAELLEAEICYAVANVCNTSTADDLVKDPNRRLQLENALETTLEKTLSRYGLEIVRVAAVEFTGKEYEELRARAGEVEIKSRQIVFDQRMREMLAGDKMHQFKTEGDLEEYVRQMAQEHAVSAEHRDQELGLLKQVHSQALESREAAFRMQQAMDRAAHEIGVKIKWDEYDFDKLVKQARAKAQARAAEFEQEKAETEQALEWRQRKQAMEREHLAGMAKTQQGLSMQTLMSITDDEAKRADLLKLAEQLQAQGKSADVILALQAGKNPELAKALAEMERSKREDRDKDWAERKQLLDESAARLEKILKAALDTTAEAAKHPGNSTQVIK